MSRFVGAEAAQGRRRSDADRLRRRTAATAPDGHLGSASTAPDISDAGEATRRSDRRRPSSPHGFSLVPPVSAPSEPRETRRSRPSRVSRDAQDVPQATVHPRTAATEWSFGWTPTGMYAEGPSVAPATHPMQPERSASVSSAEDYLRRHQGRDGSSGRTRRQRDVAPDGDAGFTVRSAVYTEEDYREDVEASGRKRTRRSRFAHEPSLQDQAPPGYQVRSAFYTEDDYRDARGLSGRSRRRGRVIEGAVGAVASVAQGVGSAAVAVVSHLHGLLAVVMIVMAVLSLYAPVRELYVANRKIDELQATYDALLEENDVIRNELDALQTREGIENEARTRGYVGPGETKVIVQGLPDDGSGHDVVHEVSDIEVPDARPWYLVLLDTFFDYDPEA